MVKSYAWGLSENNTLYVRAGDNPCFEHIPRGAHLHILKFFKTIFMPSVNKIDDICHLFGCDRHLTNLGMEHLNTHKLSCRTSPLVVTALKKTYAKVTALNDVSFSLDGSGVTAILGPNGAGKTTLINCVLGLVKKDSGDISVFGHEPGQMKARRRVGVMLQDTDLPDLLTGRELLALFASYYPSSLDIEDVISLTDTASFIGKRYKKLSGGQKRRVQFALAIIGNPDVLFLDEPTTGLDTDARKALWDIVRAFVAQGKTIVLTTHYLEEADALADRIIVIGNGKIIADASADDIRNRMSGSVIRCQTRLSASALAKLDGYLDTDKVGRFTDIRTQDSAATLRQLLAQDDTLSDLTISRPRLEDAFSELTSDDA